MAPRETENNAYAKIGVTNKEHYSMLWYFLEWSITAATPSKKVTMFSSTKSHNRVWLLAPPIICHYRFSDKKLSIFCQLE